MPSDEFVNLRDRKVIHVRFPRDLVREIDHLAVDWDTERQGAVVRLLTYAVEYVRKGGAMP